MSLIFTPRTGYNQLVITSGITQPSTPRMETNGLILYLDAANPRSYNSGDTTWNDISGRNNHFTLTGSSASVRPTFSGSNYGYINFIQSGSSVTWAERTQNFSLLSNYSVEIWVRFNSAVSGTSCVITNTYTGRINFSIGINGNQYNQRWVSAGRYTSAGWIDVQPFVPKIAEWYQLVYTYDNTTGNNSLYINSELYSSLIDNTAPGAGSGLRIARRWDGSAVSSNVMDISVSVVRIYNNALTQTQINNNYNGIKNRYYQNIPSINYILDSYPNAIVAYSLRKLKSSYVGNAVEVTRTSDNSTLNIGFNSNGDFNISQLRSFLTGNTFGYLTKWYDQSGNNNHMSATTSTAPFITLTNIEYFIGGRSCFYSANYNNLNLTNSVTNAQSIFMVLGPEYNPFVYSFLLGHSNGGIYDYHAGDNGFWLSSTYASNYVYNGSNYMNGVAYDFTITAQQQSANQYNKPFCVTMIHQSPSGRFNRLSQDRTSTDRSRTGRVAELIVYSGNQKDNRLIIEKNISDYYSLFPL